MMLSKIFSKFVGVGSGRVIIDSERKLKFFCFSEVNNCFYYFGINKINLFLVNWCVYLRNYILLGEFE